MKARYCVFSTGRIGWSAGDRMPTADSINRAADPSHTPPNQICPGDIGAEVCIRDMECYVRQRILYIWAILLRKGNPASPGAADTAWFGPSGGGGSQWAGSGLPRSAGNLYHAAGQGRCVDEGDTRAGPAFRSQLDDERVQPVGHSRFGGRPGSTAERYGDRTRAGEGVSHGDRRRPRRGAEKPPPQTPTIGARFNGKRKSHRADSNRQPAVYKTAALPVELQWQNVSGERLPSGPPYETHQPNSALSPPISIRSPLHEIITGRHTGRTSQGSVRQGPC